jgi:hypothetical protein
MNKSFYVVIPFSVVESKEEGFFDKLKNIIGSKKSNKEHFEIEKLNQYRAQLDQRINMVTQGLQALGIKSIPLNDEQLTQLYFEFYNIGK